MAGPLEKLASLFGGLTGGAVKATKTRTQRLDELTDKDVKTSEAAPEPEIPERLESTTNGRRPRYPAG